MDKSSYFPVVGLMGLLASVAWSQGGDPAPGRGDPQALVTMTGQVRDRSEAILDAAAKSDDYAAAVREATSLLDQVIAFVPRQDEEAYRVAALTLRTVTQLDAASKLPRRELLAFLREHPVVGSALAFLLKPQDRPAAVYALLNRLRLERGQDVPKLAALVAALCVVHDQPLTHRINENSTTAADALAIFDFYRDHAAHMALAPGSSPAELMVYVVDTAVSVKEMNWALERYAGHPRVGALFFDIQYDLPAFLQGKPKVVTTKGWNLPNILEYGGVCADQAYFAVAVGKSIGVPTAYTWGSAADASHAWVGFLEVRGKRARWNSLIGRYEAYQGVRGSLQDPQTREEIPDGHVAVLGEGFGRSVTDRQEAVALTDAADRVLQLLEAGQGLDVAPLIEGRVVPTSPTVGVTLAEDLLESAVRKNPGYPTAWLRVRDLAQQGKLSLQQKRFWSKRLGELCGSDYPDFSVDILVPMIQSVEDPQEQSDLWESLFRMFPKRADLSAMARVEQGKLWLAQGEKEKAGRCFEDVVSRFAAAGPFVFEALASTEEMLTATGRQDKIITLYQRTWSSIPKPQMSIAVNESNWMRVGKLYADRLEAAGRLEEAKAVREQLGRLGG